MGGVVGRPFVMPRSGVERGCFRAAVAAAAAAAAAAVAAALFFSRLSLGYRHRNERMHEGDCSGGGGGSGGGELWMMVTMLDEGV